MEAPKWTDIVQTLTGVLTVLFTGGSLVYLAIYTHITQKAYEVAQKAHEESARPVLRLVRVKMRNGRALAVYKNSGQGLALNLARKILEGSVGCDSNVIAPKQMIVVELDRGESSGIIDMRYASLSGKELCTVSCFLEDGSAFNEYVPDATIGEEAIKTLYSQVRARATMTGSGRLLARVEERNRNAVS